MTVKVFALVAGKVFVVVAGKVFVVVAERVIFPGFFTFFLFPTLCLSPTIPPSLQIVRTIHFLRLF